MTTVVDDRIDWDFQTRSRALLVYYKTNARAIANFFEGVFGKLDSRELAWSQRPDADIKVSCRSHDESQYHRYFTGDQFTKWLSITPVYHIYFGPMMLGEDIRYHELCFESDPPTMIKAKNFVVKVLNRLVEIFSVDKVYLHHSGNRSVHVFVLDDTFWYFNSSNRRTLLSRILPEVKGVVRDDSVRSSADRDRLMGGISFSRDKLMDGTSLYNYKSASIGCDIKKVHGRVRKVKREVKEADTAPTTDVRRVMRFPLGVHSSKMRVTTPITFEPTDLDAALYELKRFKKPLDMEDVLDYDGNIGECLLGEGIEDESTLRRVGILQG